MANTSRRVPPPGPNHYAAVPQSPGSAISAPKIKHNRPSVRVSSTASHMQTGRGAIAHGVASGAIGGGYGPYSYHPTRDRDVGVYNNGRFSSAQSEISTHIGKERLVTPNTSTVPQSLWDRDPDIDDPLHNPDPIRDAKLDRSFTLFSTRGWINASALFILVVGLILLFAGYPIIVYLTRPRPDIKGYNLGGINGTGQIPDLPNLPALIDHQTDSSVYTRVGTDGKTYDLVFSDEFNTDGRTFYPGEDPFWEAADLHYWPTGDLEWYDPSAITTANGKLVITLSEQSVHGLNFMSGMLTSWNKLCFTTGIIEVSVSLPGSPTAPGLWPGVWTMGNLGRAGYGATTEGMWPYSYDSCDLGTFINQTSKAGAPQAAATGSPAGGPLSFLPGQRLSACTCPGSDHPGPSVNKGRGVPEIDVLEAQVDTSVMEGQVSQSFQTAPYNYQYAFVNTTPATTIYDGSKTRFNSYIGGVFQQALSAVTYVDAQHYNNNAYAPYAFEWWSNPSNRNEGYITWFSNSQKTWTLTEASIGPDSITQVSQRLIPEEPMYLVFNLGLSPSFQAQDYKHLVFPSKMYIDYVRIYQRQGTKNGLTCNPPSHPTTNYINNHLQAYSDANLTTWAQAGYTFPRNSLYDGC